MRKFRTFLLLTLCLLCAYSMIIACETTAKAVENVSKNLTVDGQIYTPETGSLSVFLSKRKDLLAENIFDVIGIGDAGNWSKETVQVKYGTKTKWSEKNDDAFCTIEPGRIYYIRDDFLPYENILEFYLGYGTIPNYGPFESNRWNLSRNPIENAACEGSLPFMSADEAVTECINVLTTIGIDGEPVLIDFHAFSGEALAKDHAKKLQNDPAYAAFVSLGAKDVSPVLNDPKDIYCLLFGFRHNNIWTLGPLEQVATLPSGDDYALTQKAVFYLSSDGFMKIELQNMTEPVSGGEGVPIMTYSDALSRAADVLANDPTHNYCVREAYLSYLPVDKMNGQIEYRPHWNFFLTYDYTNDENKTVTWARVLRVDAVSGQIIW